MEHFLASVLAAFIPLALLWLGISVLMGRSIEPAAVLPQYFRLLLRILRWLWQERPQRGRAGRVHRPPIRYRE